MTHKNKIIQFSAISLFLSIALTLVACGGGGGGGTSYPNISYSGVTTAATVDETNAADFPVVMLEGSTSSAQSNPLAAELDSAQSKSAQHATMLNILTEQVKKDIINKRSNSDSSTVTAASQTINGDCPTNPGSATITDNSTLTNINASFTYNNFCVGDLATFGLEVTLHGKINITGSWDGNAGIINNMTMSIPYMKLTVVTNTDTYSEEFSGSIAVIYDGSVFNNVDSMTISTNFQANGLTYKIENLVVDTSGGTFAISGRFYHPTHGYVEVTTTEPFNLYISSEPDKYCSGTMKLAGNGGVIEFTANADCTQYQVTFTATGNLSGIPDYDSLWVAWP